MSDCRDHGPFPHETPTPLQFLAISIRWGSEQKSNDSRNNGLPQVENLQYISVLEGKRVAQQVNEEKAIVRGKIKGSTDSSCEKGICFRDVTFKMSTEQSYGSI